MIILRVNPPPHPPPQVRVGDFLADLSGALRFGAHLCVVQRAHFAAAFYRAGVDALQLTITSKHHSPECISNTDGRRGLPGPRHANTPNSIWPRPPTSATNPCFVDWPSQWATHNMSRTSGIGWHFIRLRHLQLQQLPPPLWIYMKRLCSERGSKMEGYLTNPILHLTLESGRCQLHICTLLNSPHIQ